MEVIFPSNSTSNNSNSQNTIAIFFSEFNSNYNNASSSFSLSNFSRYSDSVFEGVMIDTGAARVSTDGHDQLKTLK
ncbi:hypothetical protein Golomagni_04644 [Golovinomyces magnicellulatus]|nr:hypothetical protein Golomagni_04644 [Golovinomyces magnicellulatus]